MKYGLEDAVIQKIQNVFGAFPQVNKAVLYRSRANGKYKPGSDIDMTLKGTNINLSVMNQIGLSLDDLLLPYTFDLSVFEHIKDPDLADTVINSDHQIVVKNISWIFPWYSSLEVKNIHSYISVGTPIRVFVQRDNNSIWMEATPVSEDSTLSEYEYFIEKRQPDGAGMYNYGSLYVFYYGMDTTDTPDVKVQF